jgi:eukaryotic-like serine/threonine-protein kinase
MIGKTLGHYEITSQLGKGGMGEVYQAKDQILGRDVAIKVLPEEFAKDTDRVARFQREAKLLASLNHPNIGAIHGLEESDGTNFLVLELVEGETLADQIKKGPIPVEESLKLALQIAEALEAAHEKGVIHRDLKPANIKVTPEGKVKVLDFGLAKAFAAEQENLNLTNSPTLSNAATQQGVILGTAAYMSPEQARGKAVDKRADVWAFGCLLYEMLSGHRTWTGDTVTDIIASALAKDPDFTKLPSGLHPRILELLSRCLQKDPAERWRDVGDIRIEIKQILADSRGVFMQPVTTAEPRKRLRTMLPWLAAAIVIGAIIAGIAVWKLKPPEPRRVISFDYHLPEGQEFNNEGVLPGQTLAVSHNGSQFIYSIRSGLYLRSESELQAQIIPGTEDNPQSPFFSPDDQSVGYWSQADNKLKRISIRGGAPVALCDASFVVGAIWYSDNTIVYAERLSGIKRVSADGGTPETLVEGSGIIYPQLLPDGKSVLFTESGLSQKPMISVQSLGSGKRKKLFRGSRARYLPTGHLVYSLAANNTLSAVAFNPATLEVTGGHVPVVQGVGRYYAISDSGDLVYLPERTIASGSAAMPKHTLVWVDRKGKEEPLAAEANLYQYCKISPDGTKVVLAIGPVGNHDIYVLDLNRGTMPKLTFDEADDYFPLWTRDGQRIVFYSGRGEGGIYWKAANNTGGDEKLCSLSAQFSVPFSWSGDGSTLVIQDFGLSTLKMSIATMSLKGNRERKPLLEEKYLAFYAQVSPDGKWIAYTSNESGQMEVYVRSFPAVDSGGRWMVSNGGGDSPLWSPGGKELYYRNGEATLAVPVKTEPTLTLGKPETLFRGKYDSIGVSAMGIQYALWDIHPDGKRFLMVKPTAATTGGPPSGESTGAGYRKINVVVNWTEELKQRVPVK